MIAALTRWLAWFTLSTLCVWGGMRAAKATAILEVALDPLQAGFVVALLWMVLFAHDVVLGETRGRP